MKIAVVNPNSTQSMTDKIATAARQAVGLGIEIEARTCHDSPPAIQGPEDGALAKPHVLSQIAEAEAQGAKGAIIACFDDPALDEARAAAGIPVVGIGQAGYHAAMLLAPRFSVVTTLPVAIPVLEGRIRDFGLSQACAKVRASNVAVLDLEKPGTAARDKVSAEIGCAVAEDGAGAIVLGCAGMADLAPWFAEEHGVPIVDGVAAATGLIHGLIALGPAAFPARRVPCPAQ